MKSIGNRRTTKIIVDIFMTIFLIMSFIRWEDSNFIFHAVVGTACTVFFALHIIIHRKWLKATTKSLFAGKLNKALRSKYAIDILLLAVWGAVIVTGFLAIGYFSSDIESMAVFSRLHAVTSRVGLALIIIHAFQHRMQIKSYVMGKRNKKRMRQKTSET